MTNDKTNISDSKNNINRIYFDEYMLTISDTVDLNERLNKLDNLKNLNENERKKSWETTDVLLESEKQLINNFFELHEKIKFEINEKIDFFSSEYGKCINHEYVNFLKRAIDFTKMPTTILELKNI